MSLKHRKTNFNFWGYDFMIDEDLKVYLIEVNTSPGMENYSIKELREKMTDELL